jgi:purine-nucleoside phosphorylase
MSKAYDPDLIHAAQNIAREIGMDEHTHAGVYTCVGGPNYETVAELRMWKILGVDAVGMSTVSLFGISRDQFEVLFTSTFLTRKVHEVITARHCDMRVFAFSLITNKCETEYEAHGETNHEDVVNIGLRRQDLLTKFVSLMVEKMTESMP